MVAGFSKLDVEEKINELIKNGYLSEDNKKTLHSHQHTNFQDIYNQFSENTISNFFIPYGIAPGFIINGKSYVIPMAIEESSVIAAASKAAKFWSNNGGFKTKVISTAKVGQLFFSSEWNFENLIELMSQIKEVLRKSVSYITRNMETRGGGISGFELDYDNEIDTYCLMIEFETIDSMGANFINSCLETMGSELVNFLKARDTTKHTEISMAILSNYTPHCLVECKVTCKIDALRPYSGNYSPHEFAHRFKKAVLIAEKNSSRAVTHNKGIMNGIDAVVIATGNDFRAIEAGVHAYASKFGKYSSLTKINVEKDHFEYTLTIPLALGTVGGLTKLHPLAKLSLELLGNPSAKELMAITASAGMANNFSAIAALVTSGIQKGHMKMHLSNIFSTFNATEAEINKALEHFNNNTISHSAVKMFLDEIRNNKTTHKL